MNETTHTGPVSSFLPAARISLGLCSPVCSVGMSPSPCLCRYEFIVSIPLNHDRRLDMAAHVIYAPDALIAPAEGVLGQTLKVLYGEGPLDSAFDQSDMEEVWDPEEGDHIHHSPNLEAFLSGNYRVSGLFADDAVRTNFKKELEHVRFQVRLFSSA